MGVYLTDLAAVLRVAGLDVVELDGWATRARSTGGYDGGPWCLMLHHTASGGDGAADAHYCSFVDDDRPVCNLVIGRDGVVHVCAAGATNCNGKGGPYRLADGRTVAQDQMNLRAVAVELSNGGTGMTYPAVQIAAMFAVWAAVADAYLGGVLDLAAQHVDWAPGRKIDPATAAAVDPACGWQPAAINTSGSWDLADVTAEASRRHQAAPPKEDDMTTTPANVYLGDELHVFTRGGDGALWHQWYTGAWNSESLGGHVDSAPAAAARPLDDGRWRIDVTAQGDDGALWQIIFDGASWSGWVKVSGWPGC